MTITSNYDSKCKGTVNPATGTIEIHTWKVGNQIHYQKEPKCICINEDCFNRQKEATAAVVDVSGVKLDNKQFVPQTRTTSEKTDDNKEMLEINWQMASSKALEALPKLDDENAEYVRQRLIITQTIFKSLCYNWVRP